MFQQLIKQFHQFSRENWWIYIIFTIAFLIIIYTGKGNLYEIIGIFLLNILWNVYMLLMQDSFKDEKFRTGAIFLLIWNVLYWILALYSFFVNNEPQYLLWQIGFQLAGIKTFLFFYHDKQLKYLSFKFMLILSIMLVFIGAQYLGISGYSFFQSIWFALTVVGISEVSDLRRYFLIFLWVIVTAASSFAWLYINYLDGNIFGITISFAILSLSSSIFYLKILPNYISRLKNI